MTAREWIYENWKDFDNRAECIRRCSEVLGIHRRTAQKAAKKLEQKRFINWGAEIGDKQQEQAKVWMDNEKLAHLDLIRHVPTTVEDIMEISQLDPAIWEVARQRGNFWGNRDNPNYQIRAEFIRKVSEEGEWFLQDIKERIKEFAPIYPELKYELDGTGYLLELSLYDAHLGLQTPEYNPKKGAINYFLAIQRILSWYRNMGINIVRIVLVVGNDFFNANDRYGQTVKGNRREEHPNWKRTYRIGFDTLVKSIDLCQTVAPVDIITVEGNHDADRTFYVVHSLEAWYHNCPQVRIINDRNDFQFYRWENNLLGFTHGDCKIAELPMIMATQAPGNDWAQSTFRMWRIGHKHHSKTRDYLTRPVLVGEEVHGVRVQMSPGLCDRSTWEKWHGYLSIREALGALWHPTEGDVNYYGFKI